MKSKPGKTLKQCALLCGFLFSGIAAAQGVYKCGSVYSDKPCGDNESKVKVSGAPSSSAANGSDVDGSDVCLNMLKAQLVEPDSATTRNVAAGKPALIDYQGGRLYARTIVAEINSRSSSGGFTGFKAYTCYMSEDARRVLKTKEGV